MVTRRRLIVTGGSSGIGLSFAKSLTPAEWSVVMLSRDEIRGKAAIEELKKTGIESSFIKLDLRDLEAVDMTMDRIVNEYDDIYGVVNNAGMGLPEKIDTFNTDYCQEVFAVNLFAPLIIIKKLVPCFKNRLEGRVVNIASVAGKLAVKYLTSYSASKAALISVTQSLAQELAGFGITVNCVCPAVVDTNLAQEGRRILAEMNGIDFKIFHQEMLNKAGVTKPILTDEVARVVEFLVRKETSYINGQSINVCGMYEVR